MRLEETFPPHQGGDLAGLGKGIHLGKDPQHVIYVQPPTLGPGQIHFPAAQSYDLASAALSLFATPLILWETPVLTLLARGATAVAQSASGGLRLSAGTRRIQRP